MTKRRLTKLVWDRLATVIDPELGINIVDMGLIYNVKISPIDQSKHHKKKFKAEIEMTLTIMGCPLAGVIHAMVVEAVSQASPTHLIADNVTVNLTFDPPWTSEMMSQEAQAKLKFLL